MAPQTTAKQISKGIAARVTVVRKRERAAENSRWRSQISRINERYAAEQFIAKARAEAKGQ